MVGRDVAEHKGALANQRIGQKQVQVRRPDDGAIDGRGGIVGGAGAIAE
jgi:hypothetical protein